MIYYYILDTETTGLKAGFHEINEISVLRVSDKKQVNGSIAVDFPNRANYQALQIQGKTFNDLKNGEDKYVVLKRIHDFIEEDGSSPEHRCIVAHNYSFDQRFCHMEWESQGMVFPAHLWLCTKAFSKKFIKTKNMENRIAQAQGEQKVKYGLNRLMEGFGLPIKDGAHSASVDTYNTSVLFDHLHNGSIEHVSSMKRKPHKEDKKELDMDDF
jgi:DNA polymerase III epsilon subunit-like protein